MNRAFRFALLVLCFSSFTACVSKPVPIPGDKKYVIDNIYAEYMNIADVYLSLEKYDKAAQYYKLAMQNSKLYWGAYYKLGKSYVLQNDWKNALPIYKKLLERDPQNCSFKSSLAYIYAVTGKLKTAKQLYFEVIQAEGDNYEYLENYIAVLLLANDTELAKAYFDRLKDKFPDSKNIEKFQEEINRIFEKELIPPEISEEESEAPLQEDTSQKSSE